MRTLVTVVLLLTVATPAIAGRFQPEFDLYLGAVHRTESVPQFDQDGQAMGFGLGLRMPNDALVRFSFRQVRHDVQASRSVADRFDLRSWSIEVLPMVWRSGRSSLRVKAGAGRYDYDAFETTTSTLPDRFGYPIPTGIGVTYSHDEQKRALSTGVCYRVRGPGAWGLGIDLDYVLAGSESYLSIGLSPFSVLF